jgi:hypothetical protein
VDAYLETLDFGPRASDVEEAGGDADGLVEAMRYSLLAGGKRIRPVLALATAESLGEPPERLLPTAAELRAGKLEAAQAAVLVERCAELAAGIASELDRQVRELEADPPDQESLL